MTKSSQWKQVWEAKAAKELPDFELDRGRSVRDRDIECLSEEELIAFAEPAPNETVLDAGCGTGVNVLRLQSRVKRMIAFDYAWGSVTRCERKIRSDRIDNVSLCVASVCAIPLPANSVDRVLCLSVLQYLDDNEVRAVLREFLRVLNPNGVIVLHVKNASSLYWRTLRLVKYIKALFGYAKSREYVRPFHWYVQTLGALNCRLLDYNSFNVLMIEGMPRCVRSFLQRLEFKHRCGYLMRSSLIRKHGAELKLKATVGVGVCGQTT